MIQTFKTHLACEPFPTNAVQTQIKSGFAFVDQVQSLTPLKVIFGNESHRSGSTIYVNGESMKHAWALAKKRLVTPNCSYEFIMVPVEFVQLFEDRAPVPAVPRAEPGVDQDEVGRSQHGVYS